MENSAYRKESDGLLSVVICLNLSCVPIISLCNKFLRRKGGDACLYTDRYIHFDHIVKFHVKIWSKLVGFAGLSSLWLSWGWGCDGGRGVTGLNPHSRGWERTGPHTHYPRIQFFEIGKPMS